MSDETAPVPPAMSAAEWERALPSPEVWADYGGSLYARPDAMRGRKYEDVELDDRPHAMAALCLYGQPYGFTREDVRELENAADHHDWVDGVEANRIRSIAARLAALLPPDHAAERPTPG